MQDTTINFEEALKVADEAVFASEKKHLSDVEITILRGSWQNQTYEEMASTTEYAANYLQRTVGHKFWKLLSKALGEEVSKTNFRTALERRWRDRAPANTKAPKLEFKESTAAEDSPFYYVERPPIEQRCYEAIKQPGCLICIKAPERMGKTLLSGKILEQATFQAYRTVYLNLNLADKSDFTNLDNILRWFCVSVARELRLPNKLDDYWDERYSSSKANCTAYFEHYLLANANTPLALCLDEIDLVFPHEEIAESFLSLLRVWHEKGKISNIWKKLRLILVHSTKVYIDLDINQSPFNVGLPIELPEFNEQQVQKLARLHGLNWSVKDVKQLMAMVGGHPDLVQQAISYLKSYKDITFEQFLKNAPTEAGIYGNHLRRLWARLEEHPELLEALKKVVASSTSVRLESEEAYKLNGMGLVQLQGNDCNPRCDLYRQYFRDRLGIK